jgi:hypothetical protein
MAHSSIYEDFFVDQSVPHTVALVLSSSPSHAVMMAMGETFDWPEDSHVDGDEHITKALYEVIALSREPDVLFDEDLMFSVSLLFVDCDDVEQFRQRSLSVRLAYSETLIGCLRFDREHRIMIGALYDELQRLVAKHQQIESLIGTDDEPHDLFDRLDRVRSEIMRLSPMATNMLDQIKL